MKNAVDTLTRNGTTRQVLAADVPPHAYFLISALFHYLGPAFAVLLFAQVSVLGVAWTRIASAAAILALWRRPWRQIGSWTRPERRALCALGIVLGLMNVSFYLAIARLPLATVGAIEFLGPPPSGRAVAEMVSPWSSPLAVSRS